ncbi:hypothetical protein BGX27_008880, partial [Mortierella sp. AM989]
MKGGHQTEIIIGDESLEWIEQHHRNTSHKSLSNTFDNSGDESDYEKHRQSLFYTPDPQKRTKEYHIEQATQAIQLLKAASKPTGWKKVLKHKSGCLVYQSTSNGDKHPIFKGEHVIRGYRAQDVFSVVGVRKLWELPKFIARRALAKRPLVITTIETHLKKNGVSMVMSSLVSQTANRHRSLSEPLKPEKFSFADPHQDETVQNGSAFLSPMGPITSEKDVEQLDDRDEFGDYDDEMIMITENESSATMNPRSSLAPSIFTSEFLENNAVVGDTALFGDSQLFGKGGIFQSTLKSKDGRSITPNDESRSHSPQPPHGTKALPTRADNRHHHSVYRTSSQSSGSISNPKPRKVMMPSAGGSGPPHVVTPATPPLTPTTSIDGKDATSDSDASSTPKVKIVPRTPKQHVSLDASLPARPSSMMFAAYGMRSPSDIMESRRHSTLMNRSSSFTPRHSHIIPLRGSTSTNFQSFSKSAGPTSPLSNAMKRHSTAPSLDSNRSLTLLPPPVPHRHSETARKALAMFKVLASSPEDRWRAVTNDGAFKSYSRVISGAGLPMLRGEGVITGGWTVEQINAVIESSGCRQIWDERFENMSIAETFNSNEYLFHVSLQGIGSLTGRDLAGVTIIDRDPNTSALYNVSTSVLDSTIPEDPGRIRALLELSGWSLRPIFDGHGNTLSVNVTFVIQIDIRGTLPNSVVKSLTAGMMTAVPRLNHFINKSGYPPYASQISGTRLLDTFDPKTGFYELCYKTAPGWTEVRVGRKVYKEGYDFFIKPDDPTVRVELAPDFGGVRIWTTLDHEGQSITAQVSRKGQIPVNPTKVQSLRMQEDDDDENDRAGRRSRDSFVPRHPRDSRVYESSTPTYGGASLRKSSSHLKSNDQTQNAEEVVDGGSPADVGSGSDLRPKKVASSIRRKRRSASFSTLSAFDPNLIIASSSDRSAETPQTSMTPKASEESERSRSRSRTPRSLSSVLIGASSPPPPRRSTSLGRYSIPFTNSQDNTPPVPTPTSIRSPTFGPPPSIIPAPVAALAVPAISTNISGPASICSPMSSPTLGPFHMPRQPVEPRVSLDDDILFLDTSLQAEEYDLQPAAEIPSCPRSSKSDTENMTTFSTNATFSSSSDITMVSLDDMDSNGGSAFSLDESMSEPKKSLVSESTETTVSDSSEAVISLANMDSPMTSPLPVPAIARRKDSGSRRVTFSPDVVDNPENRAPLHRVKKSSRKRSSSSAKDPPSELEVDGSIKLKDEDVVVKEVAESKSNEDEQVIVRDERGNESDESEEFVEAPTELESANMEEKEKSGPVDVDTRMMVVEKKKLTMEHLLDNEEVWQFAIQSFIEELESMQIKLAVWTSWSARRSQNKLDSLKRVNELLKDARQERNPEKALKLCAKVKSKLEDAEKIFAKKNIGSPIRDDGIANAYHSLGNILDGLQRPAMAKESHAKAAEWGYTNEGTPQTVSPRPEGSNGSVRGPIISVAASIATSSTIVAASHHVPGPIAGRLDDGNILHQATSCSENKTAESDAHASFNPQVIFTQDVVVPVGKYGLPEDGAPITSTLQLAYFLGLPQTQVMSTDGLDASEGNSPPLNAINPDEQDRLQTISTNMVRAFIRDDLKKPDVVAEI